MRSLNFLNTHKLFAGFLALVLVAGITSPAFAQERTGDTFSGPVVAPLVDGTFCDSATAATQCATVLPAGAPLYVQEALDALGVDVSGACADSLIGILSTGDPLDGDDDLSTDMGNPGCGMNPDGFSTFDCVDVAHSATADTTVIIGSSEWPEFVGSEFTDWQRIQNGAPFNWSIDAWPPGDVSIIPFGPADTGVLLAASIAAGEPVTLRVADSGDEIYDTFMLVLPAECTDIPVLCGDGELQAGEQCDDGNNESGDGCSDICTFEGEPPIIPIGGTVGSMSTTSLLVAGAQDNMGLWSLALVGIVGAAAAITYKVKSKKTKQ